MASSPPKPSADFIPLEELVFSCAICQATPSEVYATCESNQGFNSGSGGGDMEGVVTKMWIAECSHVTCAKHLENGAAPFHPAGQQPKAPCPKCVHEKGDATPKNLFGIRGLGDGEYDSMIPSEWRKCPAIKLDTSIPGMDAVRFQYMALSHYARQARRHWKAIEAKQLRSDAVCSEEQARTTRLQREVHELKGRVKDLEKIEVQYKKWEARKPEIRHYLEAVGPMSDEIERMRTQLHSLGVHIPKSHYSFDPKAMASRDQGHSGLERDEPREGQHHTPFASRKRKRDVYSSRALDHARVDSTPFRRSSREIMPPPPPKSSPHKLLHHNGAAFRNIHAGAALPHSDPSAQFYQERDWQGVPDRVGMEPIRSGYSTVHDNQLHGNESLRHANVYQESSPRLPGWYRPSTRLGRSDHPRNVTQAPRIHPPAHVAPATFPSGSQQVFTTSAISPFFRRTDTVLQDSPMKRPPTRGSFLNKHHEGHPSRDHDLHGSNTASMIQVRADNGQRAANRMSFLQHPHQQPSQVHVGQSPMYRAPATSNIRTPSMMPQTPRNADGLLRRPDPYPSSGPYWTGRPNSSFYGAAPSMQTPSFGGSNMNYGHSSQNLGYTPRTTARPSHVDEALSQVPGARGLRVPPTLTTYSQPRSSYGAVRGPFSSAGSSRRSVRR